MNKFMKVLAASALIATALVGCGGDDKKAETTAAKYAKVGFGMIITPGDQTSTTTATVALNKDGKVEYIDIDAIQTPNKKDETKTKKELGTDYGMTEASAIKKEWKDQAEAFEKWATGKTLDDIAKVETMEYHGGKAPKTGSDLAAGCTIVIDDMLAAVAKAGTSMVEVSAEKVGTGEIATWDAEKKQKNTTVVSVALDKDGKILWSNVDCSQNPNGKTETKSKKELAADYAMKDASAIKKEWFEQIKAFEDWAKDKTADQIAKVETMEYHGGKAPKTGTDLAAGCTIVVDDILGAYVEAFTAAK